jgi:hypothetical protein
MKILGSILLLFTFVGGSLIGSIVNIMDNKSTMLINCWRFIIMVIYMSIPFIAEIVYYHRILKDEENIHYKFLNTQYKVQILTRIFLASFVFVLSQIGFIYAAINAI